MTVVVSSTSLFYHASFNRCTMNCHEYIKVTIFSCYFVAFVTIIFVSLGDSAAAFSPSFSIDHRHRPMGARLPPMTKCASSTQLQLVVPEISFGSGAAAAGLLFAGWLYVDGADDRQRRNLRQQEEERYRQYQEERYRQAYVEPRDYWTKQELAQYDGTQDPDGPILLAADGLVFNVYRGRNFYGPGGEYHLFAGRDATRFLAKTIVEEETPEEAARPLTMAERAALAAWLFTFKGKYEIVGKLEGFDPATTSMKSIGS